MCREGQDCKVTAGGMCAVMHVVHAGPFLLQTWETGSALLLMGEAWGGHVAEIAKPRGQNLDLNKVLLTPSLALLGPHVSPLIRVSEEGRKGI